MAMDAGASALGLVSAMPSGPGVISETMIAAIADFVPPSVATFLLTSLQDAEEIVAQHGRCGTNTIQICDRLLAGSYDDLRKAMPGIKIVQVIHVTGEESIAEAVDAAAGVHASKTESERTWRNGTDA